MLNGGIVGRHYHRQKVWHRQRAQVFADGDFANRQFKDIICRLNIGMSRLQGNCCLVSQMLLGDGGMNANLLEKLSVVGDEQSTLAFRVRSGLTGPGQLVKIRSGCAPVISPSSLYETLANAIADGGSAARNVVEKVARDADDLEVIFPAYAALTSWGEDGLDLIVRIALDRYTVKSKSAAMTILTVLSASGEFSPMSRSFMSKAFLGAVNSRIASGSMKPAARHALRELIMSLPVDDLLIPLGQSFMHLSWDSSDLAEELVSSLSIRWLRFGPQILDDYERMLADVVNDEPAFQAFFCDYPQLLDPMAVKVWSQPDFHGVFEPDFVIRRADDSYLVVEIEVPGKLLMTKARQLSAAAIQAEREAMDYETFLSERIAEARTHFPQFSRAECLVVVGMQRHLTDAQRQGLRMANDRRQGVRIVGFDWVLERGRAVIGNVSEGQIEVIRGHRVV